MELGSNDEILANAKNSFYPLDIVWASLYNYPPWPAIVCYDPEQNRYQRDHKVHVFFFGSPPSRAWVPLLSIRLLTAGDSFNREGIWARKLAKAFQEAKDALLFSEEQRRRLVRELVDDERENEDEDSILVPFENNNNLGEEKEEDVDILDDMDDITEYEEMRLENIEKKEELFRIPHVSQCKDQLGGGLVRKRGPNEMGLPEAEPVPAKRSPDLQATDQDDDDDDRLVMEVVPHRTDDAGFKPRLPLITLKAKDVAIGGDFVGADDSKVDLWCKLDADVRAGEGSLAESHNSDISQETLQLQNPGVAKIVSEAITCVSFHSCNTSLIVAAGDKSGKLGLWNVQQAKTMSRGVHTFQPHTESIGNLEFSKFEANKLYSSSFDGTLRCFDIESCKFDLIYGDPDLHEGIAFHQELDANTFLLAMGSTGSVGLVDTRVSNSRVSNTYQLFDSETVSTVDVHPTNGNLVLCSTRGGMCSVFDSRVWPRHGRHKKPVMVLGGHRDSSINSACYSPLTGKSICTVATDGHIRLFRADDALGNMEVMPRAVVQHSSRNIDPLIKVSWHPRRDDLFAVGSLEYPEVRFYSDLGDIYHSLNLNANLTTLKFHSSLDFMVGGSNSGQVHVFETDGYDKF